MRRVDSDYLKRTGESPAVRRIKTQALHSLHLTLGSQVVDMGCGPAIDTIELARIVGPTGRVVGIDGDPLMVNEANRAAVEEGVGACTRHLLGDATGLPLNSNEFDGCFSERVLQHLSWNDVVKASREMLRVVRPGGRLAIIDTDWGTLAIASREPWLERRIVSEHSLHFPNPFSGRFLLAAFRSAGLVDVTTEVFTLSLTFEAVEFLLRPAIEGAAVAGRIPLTDCRRWLSDLSLANDYGVFFAHVAMVLLVGSKSGPKMKPEDE